MGQAFSEAFPPKSKFSTDDIPDLTGRVVIVTGGNSGIGLVTCKYLLLKNARVYLACRSSKKAEAAIAELKKATGKEAQFLSVDLADLESIKKGAEEFLRKENELHLLFNNAGVMGTPIGELTKQGFDLQFGVNVLGHAYLTMLLLPTLVRTASSSPPGSVRVITDSSQVHSSALACGIDYATLREGPERKKLGSMMAYNQSKWGSVVLAKELARRYADKGVVSTSLNPGSSSRTAICPTLSQASSTPGAIRTDLFRNLPKFATYLFNWILMDADPNGALTQLYAGTSPETAAAHGKYFIPLAREGKARPDTDDEAAGGKLWEWIEEQVKDVQ